MTKTILITGASTGIGRATSKLFHNKGWNVVATMRTPAAETELSQLSNVLITKLDVTDETSIKAAVAQSMAKFDSIDVLVNNAGYGAVGPMETFPMENIRRQFDTNVIGLIATTKEVLPHMRAAKSGVIVNISSVGGKVAFPLTSLYSGTKFAVEGLTEALGYELGSIGIKAKLVEPGAIKTDFIGRSLDFHVDENMEEYLPTVQAITAYMEQISNGENASTPELVADVIWTAATDGTSTLRYTAGADAAQLIAERKALDDDTFLSNMKAQMGL
ncbi:MAG: short-chain dehydrogenase/reductase [Robiginitomaculum sp.]|nr:MAG: short-chain dehydrogenase/reductase [Robiginitomaculum sp.]